MNFYDAEIDFSKPDPIIKWEARCPHCRQSIMFIDNSKAPNYWEDVAKERLKMLQYASKYLKEIDNWCAENVGDTYMASSLRKLMEKFNREA